MLSRLNWETTNNIANKLPNQVYNQSFDTINWRNTTHFDYEDD